MLEKLLRRTHGVERKGKGFGKKGKVKGKGKDYYSYGSYSYGSYGSYGYGKGKDKGKDWMGWMGKGKEGKGKVKGKKGKGKSKWSSEPDVEKPHCHMTYTVPLPSMVANCVPLEAPFGILTAPSRPKLGLCFYFERGFCFHGESCLYEHSGSQALQPVNNTAWWALPSSLANRAGRPGKASA